MRIPDPHFVVFYNGERKQPEQEILKLSDLYEINEVLKKNCRSLREYMIFVEKIHVKMKGQEMEIKDAVEEAVIECIKENILRDFLTANRKEVIF